MSRENAENVVELHPADVPASPLPASPAKSTPNLVRLAYSKAETAEVLGISINSVERYVWPEVKLVRRGRLVFVPVRELHAWLERSAARTLD